MTPKVLIHSQPHLLENEICLQEHLKSFSLENTLITSLTPETILQEIKTFCMPLIVMDPTLRFLIDPKLIAQKEFDVAFFLKKQQKLDKEFLCFHATTKTTTLLQNWIDKGVSLIDGIECTLKTDAMSAKFLCFNPALKVEKIGEQTPFHRWLLKV